MTKANQPRHKSPTQKSLSPWVNAFFIGFLFGIVAYSVAVNSWGFLTLIPLVMIYKLIQHSKSDETKGKASSPED